ncbi:zinc finger protein 239-like [Anopheles maculipalpis]|uniref:zinc finger protein 239-like n=1 Tax=Anopheles maculipalpis TaxID=1496333 RepID=UPI002158D868|nr:zinc finger protein 239-like [Anopheles maculipalpis]
MLRPYEMDEFQRKINSICRLCLCDNEDILFPATKIIDSTLTVEDIGQLVGVQLIQNQIKRYAVCIDCNNQLRKFKAYRTLCLDSDVRFRKLFPEAFIEADSSEEAYTDTTKNYDSCNDASDVYSPTTNEETIDVKEDMYEIDESIDKGPSLIDIPRHDDGKENTHNSDSHEEQSNPSSPQTTEWPDNQTSTIALTAGNGTPPENANTEMAKYKELCTLCGKLVASIAQHMVTHTKELKFACQYCEKKWSRKVYLKQHIRGVHLKQVVKTCEQCNRGFSYIESYTAHMRAQHGVGESFECKICNIKFRHIGGLRGHCNRKHNPATNCECSICGMKFLDKSGLRAHHRVHSDEKPYLCGYCPKQFKRSTHRKAHELIHQGVKFPCTMCTKVYSYKTLLNLHMRKFHTMDEEAENPENDF